MAFEDDDGDRRDDGETALSVSRRAFLKTVSASSLAAGMLNPADAAAQASPAPVGPGDVPIKLTIDGKTHSLSVEPRVTLLDAMRNRLDITGLKRVCDRGTCGACTVIVEGRTHYSCSLLAIDMQGVPIRTVEALTRAPSYIRCRKRSASMMA